MSEDLVLIFCRQCQLEDVVADVLNARISGGYGWLRVHVCQAAGGLACTKLCRFLRHKSSMVAMVGQAIKEHLSLLNLYLNVAESTSGGWGGGLKWTHLGG